MIFFFFFLKTCKASDYLGFGEPGKSFFIWLFVDPIKEFILKFSFCIMGLVIKEMKVMIKKR
jgi:hypothetical protein